MSPQNQVQNKPTAGFILSLLGGIIGLVISLVVLAIGAFTYLPSTKSQIYILAFMDLTSRSEHSVGLG